MRITTIGMMVVVMGGLGYAAEAAEHVTVYLSDNAGLDNVYKVQAKGITSRMFAAIGLKVDWRTGRLDQQKEGAIEVELVTDTPSSLFPGALAYARPFEGVHIQIFWDRIQRRPSPSKVLAHVMVHEITHVLEGVTWHSEQGVMKAYWNETDFGKMGKKPLPFTSEDIAIIRLGLKSRHSNIVRRRE